MYMSVLRLFCAHVHLKCISLEPFESNTHVLVCKLVRKSSY